MDKKAIDTDIKNYKVRQGPLYKRSKFLKEWRERWIVLTNNYMYTFTNKNCDEMTDLIDLKDLKSYKSYLRKDQQMIPPGFKIRSADDMYYFCAKNCHEKWSWIVTLQRLMDYKYVGSSNYNNADWIKTKGIESQIEYESLIQKKPDSKIQGKGQQKLKQSQEIKKQENTDKLLKQIEEQKKEIQKKKKQLQIIESQLTAQFAKVQEQWRKIYQAKNQLGQQPKKEAQGHQSPEKSKINTQQPQSQINKQSEKAQKKDQKQQQHTTEDDKSGKPSVNKLKNLFEKKSEQNNAINNLKKAQNDKKKQQKQPQKEKDISFYRARTVNSLFEQYKSEVPLSNLHKFATQFLVKVSIDESCGYKSYVITQCKSNKNNKHFFEILIDLLSKQSYEQCENFMRFFQICFFQAPQAFNNEQKLKIHKILIPFLLNVNDQRKLRQILKNIYFMNKIKKYQKEQLDERLLNLIKQSQNIETINWARKIHDDL